MKLCFQRAAALAVCLALWGTTALEAANQRQYQMATDSPESIAMDGNVDQCQFSDYTPGHLGLGQSRMVRQGHFVVGADYLNIRPTFSEADGLIVITDFNPPVSQRIDYIPIEFDYSSSGRAYGGYRWDECGEEILFTYTRFQNDSNFDSGPAPTPVPPQVAVIIRDPHQEVPAGTVDRVRQDVDIDLTSYDLAFGKTIPVCSCYQKCCGGCDSCCGDTCCDPCCGVDGCSDGSCGNGCCCPCPAWDFTWRAGVRFAEVDWRRTGTVATVAPNANIVGFTSFDFEGGGPRVGLTGRRYCGQSRIFSLFASSDMAILLGDMSMVHSQANGAVVTTFSNTQLFPVLDIEVGGDIQVTDNLKLSAGYLFSAWFDMGMRDTIVPLAANQGAWWDDSNILGFDGLFARAELSF